MAAGDRKSLRMTLHEILDQLQRCESGACKHRIGWASFADEDDYDQLGQQFDEAVAAFTASDGEPIHPTPRFPDEYVERAACWQRGTMILYVLLAFEDNTRIRTLTIGLARPGTVVQLPQ